MVSHRFDVRPHRQQRPEHGGVREGLADARVHLWGDGGNVTIVLHEQEQLADVDGRHGAPAPEADDVVVAHEHVGEGANGAGVAQIVARDVNVG